MYLGIDIGSVTAKVVLVSSELKILETHYVRTHGQPFETVLNILKKMNPNTGLHNVSVTGTGGKKLSSITGADFVNEIIAQATSTGIFYPQVKTIIEIGGEDAKVIRIEPDARGGKKVADFTTNTACAAGTGSFLDQQASRLGIKVEDIGKEALKSAQPATVAARCSVFAKTDMIHLQQLGTPVSDIIAGLCFAMARNYKSNIAKGIALEKPISFQGGVAANQGMLRAFKEILKIDEKDFIVPEHFALMGAIGAVLANTKDSHLAKKTPVVTKISTLVSQLEDYLSKRKIELNTTDPLVSDGYKIDIETYPPDRADSRAGKPAKGEPVEAYVGVDVGSISTNVVVIDKQNRVLSRRYLMTAGRPIEAVRKGLLEVGKEIGDKVIIKGAGSTGSGRHLTGEFFGADTVKNEITSHARAAAAFDPKVDTIFEIGGQDSKYISLKDGVVVDFTMNKVCAAGTGSFLEEQAEKLAVKIDQEFANRAFCSKAPCSLGERCTVFVESQLNYYKQQGVIKDDLLAGLAYSIVENYLNKVVEKRKIGERIFFQGGVAFNRSVKSAFEKVVGKKIIVPPHHDILGAIGAAIIAKEHMSQRENHVLPEGQMSASTGLSKFKGFDLSHIQYESRSFECKECVNNCEIHQVQISSEETGKPANRRTLYYGSRCGKYDDTVSAKIKNTASTLPHFFKERQRIMLQPAKSGNEDSLLLENKQSKPTVGIPRIAAFFDLFPLWNTFFTELGLQVVLSDETNRFIIKKGVENVVAEPCFPIKTAHGHILNLLDKKVNYIFIPFQVNMPPLTEHFDRSYNCPYIQALPDTTKSAINYEDYNTIVLRPTFYMDRGRKTIERTLTKTAYSLERMQNSPRTIQRAIDKAFEAQERFNEWQSRRGELALAGLTSSKQPAVVLISRSYNSYDTGLNLNLVEKLRRLGVQVIPMDFLPLKSVGAAIGRDYPYMYWRAGQKILAAARFIARQKNLFAVYLTNFNCGPDSYITKFFDKEMQGKSYLSLEIDEHSADVGMLTRCEAFIDTIKNAGKAVETTARISPTVSFSSFAGNGKTVYIPYMDDHGLVVAAAMRAAGIKAEALPCSDEQSLTIGRKYTSGRECFPSITTTGDIIKKSYQPDFNPGKSAFFMPSAKGPCRFGQYNKLHRMVLDEIGLTDVELITFDQTAGFHKDIAAINSTKVKKTIWHGLIIVDLLQKLSRETRPYEVNKGETNQAYAESLKELQEFIDPGSGTQGRGKPFPGGNGKTLDDLLFGITRKFDNIKVDRAALRPRIGIVGEIYVRSNPFTNNHVIEHLEQLGAEISSPPFEEWLDYIDYIREEDYLLKKSYLSYLKQKVTLFFQEREADKIRAHFDGKVRNFLQESPTSEVLKLGSEYISPALQGEAVLSLGRAVEYAHNGYNGIVNIIPFGCMPGTIVTALLKRFKDNYKLPVLTLTMDGIKNPGEEMRLEAFVRQCAEHLDQNTNNADTLVKR